MFYRSKKFVIVMFYYSKWYKIRTPANIAINPTNYNLLHSSMIVGTQIKGC